MRSLVALLFLALPAWADAPDIDESLIPIESMSPVDAWRKSKSLEGKRVRLVGQAEVKRTSRGVYAVFYWPESDKHLVVVSVKNEDAEPLSRLEMDRCWTIPVNLETTIQKTQFRLLLVGESEFLPLDAPIGYALREEPANRTVLISPPEKPESSRISSLPARRSSQETRLPPLFPSQFPPSPAGQILPYLNMSRPVNVRGYYRQGSFVRAHTRSSPGTAMRRR